MINEFSLCWFSKFQRCCDVLFGSRSLEILKIAEGNVLPEIFSITILKWDIKNVVLFLNT